MGVRMGPKAVSVVFKVRERLDRVKLQPKTDADENTRRGAHLRRHVAMFSNSDPELGMACLGSRNSGWPEEGKTD